LFPRYVKPGNRIERLSVAPVKARPVFKLNIEVAYEDDHVAIIHKPAGFHCKGIGIQKIDNALSGNLKASTAPDMLPGGPVAAHRLDARTSGLLVVAKTRRAHMSLSQQFDRSFEDKEGKGKVHKKYIAIVMGKLEGEGSCNTDIYSNEKDMERAALTRWKALEHTRSGSFNWEWVTTVECVPLTGRTHQIRVHLQRLGHPIVGDDLYENEKFVTLKGGGLFLTSVEVSFDHPITAERLTIKTDMPQKFHTFVRRQGARLKAKDRDAEAALRDTKTGLEGEQSGGSKTCIEILNAARVAHQGKYEKAVEQEKPLPDLNLEESGREPPHKRQRGPDRAGIPPFLALPASPSRNASSSPAPRISFCTLGSSAVEAKGSLASRPRDSSPDRDAAGDVVPARFGAF